MKKYTANYTYTNPNFVIQNIINQPVKSKLLPHFYVLKNILQRGYPTLMSRYLQEKIGLIHKQKNFTERFLFINSEVPEWQGTIKGDELNNIYPAKDFFLNILPREFGNYSFIQSLILPEIEINEITGTKNSNFINQQVDFYIPLVKLVIEIDGQQHITHNVTIHNDLERELHLRKNGIETIRITTSELKNGDYKNKVQQIITHLERYEKTLSHYRNAYTKIRTNSIHEKEAQTKMLPAAVIRFQLLLLDLLIHNYLTLEKSWNFNIYCPEPVKDFAALAIEDTFIWLKQLWKLKHKTELKTPGYNIQITDNKKDFHITPQAINIDFSLFKRYTDENKTNPDVIFVRTDYFDNNKTHNYFKISTASPINYNITEADKETLQFFLENIFDKTSFREGQFPIIANALNLKDTIGLLPTGGGKSLCYQLPCLLQPSINFVVCPIKSLMYDQHDNLKKMLITNTAFITGDLKAEKRKKIENQFEAGRFLFVWISPERFQIPGFREKITSITAKQSIAYAIIDEVHCLSEWGHDFRTSYLNLARTIEALSPKDKNGEGKIKFIGLTATASVYVLKDIKVEFSRQKQQLQEENIKSLLDYSRAELQFEVKNDNGNKSKYIEDILTELSNNEELTSTSEKSAIIFTPHVNGAVGCYPLSNSLNKLYPQKVSWYSGDVPKTTIVDEAGVSRKTPVMPEEEFNKHKETVQNNFKDNKIPILVATKAFGMGIDKDNIHYTIHYGIPNSVEALYQEAGRAGRWDKNKDENKNKSAKCYILYSPETYNREKVEELFHLKTTFLQMKQICNSAGWSGKDVFKQIFLFVQGQNDIEEDCNLIINLVNEYYKPNTSVKIFWKDAERKFNIKENILQKAIYRLTLLGIVKDWTTDFVTHYEVDFITTEEINILKNISDYIHKYSPGKQVEKEIKSPGKNTFLENAIRFLLKWTFENIAYNRKQSLKTLRDWCDEFQDSESFKARIDNYFRFTETTFILQHIAENPQEYNQWFEALEITEKDSFNKIIKRTYLPEIDNIYERKTKFENLRDSISRFIESYNHNAGLNFLSGLCRLYLNQYEDSDGIERFENSLVYIQEEFTKEEIEQVLQKLFSAGLNLDEVSKILLCKSIEKIFPEKLEYLAEYYGLIHLLNDIYTQKIIELKKLNNKLYEQLGKI